MENVWEGERKNGAEKWGQGTSLEVIISNPGNLEETEAWVVNEAAAYHLALSISLARMGAQSSGANLTFLGSRIRI